MTKADEKPDASEPAAPASGPVASDETETEHESESDDADEPAQLTRGQALLRMAILTVVLFALVDVGARAAFHFHRKNVDTAAAADYPPGTYIGDFAAKVDYRFINFYTIDPARANTGAYEFDAYGFRLDKRKLRFDEPSKFKKLWVLGGSTVQGLGALGDETIPAHLNDLLEKNGSQYRAINMGQGGFTSTQELLLLIELLQSGQHPDAIISYDGATEVPFPGDIEKTGTPEWEKRTAKAKLLLDIQGDESISTLLPLTLSRTTRIDDVMLGIRRRMNPMDSGAFVASNWDVVARRYLATLNLIKAAADQQKVPSLFFFQPILQYEAHYGLRKLSDHEEKLKPRMAPDEHKRHEAIQAEGVAELRKGLGASFSDIHDVFRGHDGEKLYADARHPNGAGNAIIAARIYQELAKVEAAAAK